MTILFAVSSVLFAVAALLALYRVVVGPSILDRMIASDVILTTLMLVVGAEMVYNGHTRTIPMMLVLATTAVFATIAVARYVSKHDAAGGAVDPSLETDAGADGVPGSNDPATEAGR